MQGTIGWPSYPAREPSTLDFSTPQQSGNCWIPPRWDEVWFPDAFVGTMAQLLVAVEDGSEPEIAAATTWRRSRCARPSSPPRPIIA